MKFIITAETTDSYASVSNISIPLWKEYCDRHGYEFSVRNVVKSERGPVWERVRHIQEKLRDCDWVVHVDLDAIPTNMTISLTELIREDKSIIISKVWTENYLHVFNDGFCMFKNDSEASSVLGFSWDWLDRPEDKIFCLQDAMQFLYHNVSSCHERFGVISQKQINCFDYTLYNMPSHTHGQWEKYDFLIHFPGCSTEKRVKLLNCYKEEIIR